MFGYLASPPVRSKILVLEKGLHRDVDVQKAAWNTDHLWHLQGLLAVGNRFVKAIGDVLYHVSSIDDDMVMFTFDWNP